LDYFRLTPVSLQNSKKVEPLFASLYCIAALLRDVLPQSIFDFGKSEVGYFSTSLLCLHEPPPAFLIVFNPVNDCIRVSINNACQVLYSPFLISSPSIALYLMPVLV
jgi:hypothetical protein